MKTYSLTYSINGKLKETIIKGSKALCLHKKKLIQNNYKLGLLTII